MRSLDQLDYQIITELEANARVSILELSRKLGYPNSTIRDRIHKLEEEQIITGYTARLNYVRLGYGINAVILVSRESAISLEAALEDVVKITEVINVQYVTGEVDEILTVRARNIDHLKEIIFNKFVSFSGSTRLNTLIVLQENSFPFSPNLLKVAEKIPEEGD